MHDALRAAQVVVHVLRHPAGGAGQLGLLAKDVVAVTHHAAVGMQFVGELAGGIPARAGEVAVGIALGHLTAQRVVVDLRMPNSLIALRLQRFFCNRTHGNI